MCLLYLNSTTHWIAGDVHEKGLLPSAKNLLFFIPLYLRSTFVTDHGCVQGKTTAIFLDALCAVLFLQYHHYSDFIL